MKKLLLLLVVLSLFHIVQAQTEKGVSKNTENFNWKKHSKLAEKLFGESQYADAARHFEQAWQQKRKKLYLLDKAGQCYTIVKNYDKAIEALEFIQNDTRKFPLAKYQYAKALKQAEQYEASIEAFQVFVDEYTGTDAARYISDAIAEIKGAEYALQTDESLKEGIRIKHQGNSINSEAIEFAPTPFGNDQLFFSTTRSGKAKVFETKRNMRSWEVPSIPAQFAKFEGDHVCNTALSPDEKRMYFTVCKAVESWGATTTRCEIYVSEKLGNLWGSPKRLPDNINKENATSTQPTVVEDSGREILYFASNREGGQGGMDIWYATRDLSTNDLEYSDPRNLGAKINTAKNELTPFYDSEEGALYFSSNGHISVGGLDILKAAGKLINWETPENIGMPYNSGADDYFYIQNRYGDGGYFVSNRTAGVTKISTEHEDVFEFTKSAKPRAVTVRGTVFDQLDNKAVTNAEVSIYEIIDENRERLIKTANFINGEYKFKVAPDKDYKIVALKAGFQPNTIYLKPDNKDKSAKDILLTKVSITPAIKTPPTAQLTEELPEEIKEEKTEKVVKTTPAPIIETPPTPKSTSLPIDGSAEYIYTPQTPSEAFKIRTAAPRHDGTYYKVQLIAVAKYNENESRYAEIKSVGRLDYEHLMDKNITRVLLADFFSKADALSMLSQAVDYGFDGAFMVKYKDGERIGISR